MTFPHVLVVGAGQMGGGIAQVVAASGRQVSLHDSLPGAVERALGTMEKSLAKLAEKGGADPTEVLGRVTPVDDLAAADLLIEAVIEDAEVKMDVFRRAELKPRVYIKYPEDCMCCYLCELDCPDDAIYVSPYRSFEVRLPY